MKFPKLSSKKISIKKLNVRLPKQLTSIKLNLRDNELFKKVFSTTGLRVLVWFLFLVSITQVVFGVLIYKYHSENKVTRIVAKIVPFPIAIVNQDVITYNDYLTEKDYIHHFYASTEQQDVDYASIDKEITNQLVENRLIRFQAILNKSTVAEADIDTALNQIIDQNGGKEKVEKVLNDLYGLSLIQFRELVSTQLTREKVSNELIQKATVRHILVRADKTAPQEQVDTAKVKIDGYLTEIKGGLDFGEAAKKYSEDTGSAEMGGALEPFSPGEMVDEFSQASFSGNVGDIVGPIRTDFGWHLIKIEDKTGTIPQSFATWIENLKKNSWIIKFL